MRGISSVGRDAVMGPGAESQVGGQLVAVLGCSGRRA